MFTCIHLHFEIPSDHDTATLVRKIQKVKFLVLEKPKLFHQPSSRAQIAGGTACDLADAAYHPMREQVATQLCKLTNQRQQCGN